MEMNNLIVQTALLSVSDKTGIIPLARTLSTAGVSVLSTGGTGSALKEAGIPYTEVAAHTGFPEIMDGRVKTLHPRIHGGILARRADDQAAMTEHQITAIDLVVVNLYPFAETISREDCSRELAIENIDIGGPAMVRAAAKNHKDVLVLVDPSDYDEAAQRIQANELDLAFRERSAAKAFRHTAAYDAEIARYLSDRDEFPERLTVTFELDSMLRYGENPHQRAAFYVDRRTSLSTKAPRKVLQGKALSYNNLADVDAAIACCARFEEPACVIVKHGNPCGVATAEHLNDAYRHAFATDPTSAFGGVIAFNRELDDRTVASVIENQFVEVIASPRIASEAQQIAKRRKNLRLLQVESTRPAHGSFEVKRALDGLLVQEPDVRTYDASQLRCVTDRAPTERERSDLEFAWKVAWFVKSNAIVLARDNRTIGIGAGQMSRVVSAQIARIKAEEENLATAGSVMASDAFFPFRDGIETAAEAGVRAVIQPGGSVRDEEVIQAANEYGIAMLFTGTRHFRH